MLCQQCQKRAANVHYTQIINGRKEEMFICEQCAKEKGQMDFSPQLNLGDFLWALTGSAFGGGTGFTQEEQPEVVHCDVCGMSFEDFRKTGKLGCGHCFDTFRESLDPIFRRIHGSSEHKGKVPGKVAHCMKATNEIESLKADLQAAIGNEEYEKAAVLRDRIKELEGTANQCGGISYEK